MDEPLSNLDAKLRVRCAREVLAGAPSHRRATLYVTHDQIEAMTMGDRIAVLNGGALQQYGPPGELYDAPGEPVRRPVHRLAGDEPVRGGAR